MRQVAPTRAQWIMIFFLSLIVIGLVGAGIYEIKGIIDPATEDTISEWVFDLPTWANTTISIASFILGGILSWSAIHYVVDKNAAWRGPLTEGDHDQRS